MRSSSTTRMWGEVPSGLSFAFSPSPAGSTPARFGTLPASDIDVRLPSPPISQLVEWWAQSREVLRVGQPLVRETGAQFGKNRPDRARPGDKTARRSKPTVISYGQ